MNLYSKGYEFTPNDLNHKVLSRDEEINLANKILEKKERVRDLKDKVSGIRKGHTPYLFEIRCEERKIKSLRDYFIESNIKLVVKQSGKFYYINKFELDKLGVTLSDLLSDFSGIVLPNAVDKWDPNFGTKFSTFLVKSFYNRVGNILKGRYGNKPLSMDYSYEGDKKYLTLNQVLDSHAEKPGKEIEDEEISKLVREEIANLLSPIQLRCVQLRYRFDSGGEKMDYNQIASRIADEGFISPDTSKPYTKERIRQILLKAIKKLNENICDDLRSIYEGD